MTRIELRTANNTEKIIAFGVVVNYWHTTTGDPHKSINNFYIACWPYWAGPCSWRALPFPQRWWRGRSRRGKTRPRTRGSPGRGAGGPASSLTRPPQRGGARGWCSARRGALRGWRSAVGNRLRWHRSWWCRGPLSGPGGQEELINSVMESNEPFYILIIPVIRDIYLYIYWVSAYMG